MNTDNAYMKIRYLKRAIDELEVAASELRNEIDALEEGLFNIDEMSRGYLYANRQLQHR